MKMRTRARRRITVGAASSRLGVLQETPLQIQAMKIAAAQIACTPGDLEANLLTIKDFASRAKDAGAELIVFPEMIDTGYSMPVIQKHATSWNEGAIPRLQKMAKQLSLTIIAGVSDREGPRIYNGQVFIDGGGNIRAKYRKTHLVTAAPLDERPVFTAGDTFVSCKLDKFNLGLTICYDLRFPEVCRALAVVHGVIDFVNFSAWALQLLGHLRILALARAIGDQFYLVLANRVGAGVRVSLCVTCAITDP